MYSLETLALIVVLHINVITIATSWSEYVNDLSFSNGIHFLKELFLTSYIETSVTTALEFVQDKLILIVIRWNQLRRPFVTSCPVLNANPSTNAYFIAFVIGEHAVLKNWFIHLAIYTKINKCYLPILMVLCYSMITSHEYVLLWLVCKFFMRNRIRFLFQYLSNHRSMFTKLLEKMERKN